MLKSQSIVNVWKCDSCGVETTCVVNPYFSLSILKSDNADNISSSFDICSICAGLIPTQPVIDYISNVNK